jgi:amino acid transporter
VAFLAWIGLGADGLSSSAYGPDETFQALVEHGGHTYLALFLVAATAITVFIISYAYSRVIEHFPAGGGGYVVATKLLGNHAGVISGCALLVDYVLTITVSVAAGGDALFNLAPEYSEYKLPVEICVLVFLILINLRGVKESVTTLMPVFLVFVLTHLILIVGGIASHIDRIPEVANEVSSGLKQSLNDPNIGFWGLFLVFIKAYSRGGATYTGIEAVSNGLQIMREPRVETGKRTMLYMAISLAFTAGGILLCYLLFKIMPEKDKTMNGLLVEAFAGNWRPFDLPLGEIFVWLTLISEGAILFVAAQTGFIDGPRVMANMAVDSWLPHRFASLSDRLTTRDGVLLLGGASIILLVAMEGAVQTLVIMYAINVFLTFSLTELGMCRFWVGSRKHDPKWKRHISVHVVGLVMCVSILLVTIQQKFLEGAWLTLVITAAAITLCILVRAHYRSIAKRFRELDVQLEELPSHETPGGEPVKNAPTAVLLVRGFGGLGVHSILAIHRYYPNYFKNLMFVSVAVLDSGNFKGTGEVEALKRQVEETLEKYVALARRLGWNAGSRMGIGTDVVDESTRLCLDLAEEFPRLIFFSGKLVWKKERFYQRILHNETAYQVQRRLHWKGLPMMVLPIRVTT